MVRRAITIRPRLNYYREANKSAKLVCFLFLIFTHKVWSNECLIVPKSLPTNASGWLELEKTLENKSELCLNSSVFLALYGAAQLNSGQLNKATESLERALLLDENNGAAMIDYAGALYYSGQIFSAIDLNKQLLTRRDLPDNVKEMLDKRAVKWEESTRRKQNFLSIQTGYDSNLNNATHVDSLVLNSPGGDVNLQLSQDEQAISGKYINIKTNYSYIDHSDFREQSILFGSNLRFSDYQDSNYVQLSGQYKDKHILDNSLWYWSGQVSYVHYGGSPLSLVLTGSTKYQWTTGETCKPSVQGSIENLTALQQRALDSISLYAGIGLNCQFNDHAVEGYIEIITDKARGDNRPGGNQKGWRVNMQWQKPMLKGIFNSTLRYTKLNDNEGFDVLLSNGDNRTRTRTDFSVEYSQLVSDDTLISFSLTQQKQKSNISLFEQKGIRLGMKLETRF